MSTCCYSAGDVLSQNSPTSKIRWATVRSRKDHGDEDLSAFPLIRCFSLRFPLLRHCLPALLLQSTDVFDKKSMCSNSTLCLPICLILFSLLHSALNVLHFVSTSYFSASLSPAPIFSSHCYPFSWSWVYIWVNTHLLHFSNWPRHIYL